MVPYLTLTLLGNPLVTQNEANSVFHVMLQMFMCVDKFVSCRVVLCRVVSPYVCVSVSDPSAARLLDHARAWRRRPDDRRHAPARHLRRRSARQEGRR